MACQNCNQKILDSDFLYNKFFKCEPKLCENCRKDLNPAVTRFEVTNLKNKLFSNTNLNFHHGPTGRKKGTKKFVFSLQLKHKRCFVYVDPDMVENDKIKNSPAQIRIMVKIIDKIIYPYCVVSKCNSFQPKKINLKKYLKSKSFIEHCQIKNIPTGGSDD